MVLDAKKLVLAHQCWARGSSIFPGIEWDHAGAIAAISGAWQDQPRSDLAERLALGEGFAEEYLIRAALERRPGAVEALDRRYIHPLRSAITQICRDAELTDEVLQALREKLLLPPHPRLASYDNRGRLATWLAVVASRSALDAVRKHGQRARREAELSEELVAMATGPEVQLARQELNTLLHAALRSALLKLPPRERHALRMHLMAGWNISQIGRTFGAHRATAARWLVTARERLEREIRLELSARGGVAEDEVESLIGGMRSRFDLRMSQLFQTADPIATAAS